MPNYDWICRNCNHAFERVTRSDVYTTPCPNCLYGDAAERQPSAPAGKVQGGTPKFYK
jgi:putative FmdB family regulatory protein